MCVGGKEEEEEDGHDKQRGKEVERGGRKGEKEEDFCERKRGKKEIENECVWEGEKKEMD